MVRYKLYIFVFHDVCIVHPSATSEKNPLLFVGHFMRLYIKSIEGPPIFNMTSMDCMPSSDATRKFYPLNRIQKRASAFGNETGKLAIGEFW